MSISIVKTAKLLKISLTGTSQERNIASRLLSLLRRIKRSSSLQKGIKRLNKNGDTLITLEALKKVSKNPPRTI